MYYNVIGESRQPWANRLVSKSMKGKYLNFLHEVEIDFGNLCPSLIEKIGFPFLKKIDLIWKRQKYIFFQSFSLLK